MEKSLYIDIAINITIHAEMVQRGISARELATRVGVTHPTIIAWVSGETPITTHNVERIATAMEMTSTQFLKRVLENTCQ